METSQLRPASMLSDSGLLLTLDAVEAALSTLTTYRLHLTADLDSRGLAKEQGARDTTEYLALRHHRNPRNIRRDLKTTQALPKYEAVTAALPNPRTPTSNPTDPDADAMAEVAVEAGADRDGDGDGVPDPVVLNPGQAEAIVATLEKVPPAVSDEELRVAEEQMIEAARLLCPDELLAFGRKVLALLDTDGPEPAEDQARAKETLSLRRADGGVKFSGYLAAENAELLRTQINRLAKPRRTVDGELDPRPHDKRQADALTTILNTAAGRSRAPGTSRAPAASSTAGTSTAPGTSGTSGASGAPDAADAPDTSGEPGGWDDSRMPGVPHITITIDLDDLRNATSQAVGELVYGDNLSASAVRLLACDAAVLPIVLGSDSQPLDVGMEQRFVTRYIRRALVRRDKGCVVCKAPPWQCHAHHLNHWIDGGPTAITNLALLCAGHHRAVHAGHWTISITGGVVEVTRPTWTSPTLTRPADLAELTNLSRYLAPPPTGQAGVDPHHEHPDRHPDLLSASALSGQPSPHPKIQAGAEGLSWLTPEAVALLDPWGDSGTPSAGP